MLVYYVAYKIDTIVAYLVSLAIGRMCEVLAHE